VGDSLRCPACNCAMSTVRETRNVLDSTASIVLVRVRICRHCSYHYRTKEVMAEELTTSSVKRIPQLGLDVGQGITRGPADRQ
jgi:transcriptional regulator NrdR family protein